MNIKSLKTALFEKAKQAGFIDCEIYYSLSSVFSISIYKGEIEKYKNSESGGFSFRGLYNGKMGYYFSETLDIDLDDVIIKTKENASIISSDDKEFIFEGSNEYPNLSTYSDKINEVSAIEKINIAKELEKYAYEYDKRISVNTSVVSSSESYVYISNTKGLELSDKSNALFAYIKVLATNDNETKEKLEYWTGEDLKELNTKELAESACKKAILSLGGISIKSGDIKAIIENKVFADLLECFVGNFYADNVQKGFSLLKGKLNNSIAGSNITIIDNPLLKNGYASANFDSEGVASFNKTVVDKGILKSYLYNLKSAYIDGVQSTGNGFKTGFKGTVSTSTTNFYIQNGDEAIEKIIEGVDYGIIVTNVAGLHSGTNSISGDFSLAAGGFLIKQGQILDYVDQITIAGNFFDILKSVDAIANDLEFNLSAIGSPSLLISNIQVSGL